VVTQAASVPSDRASAGAAPAETPAVLVLPPLQAVAVIMAVNHLMLIGVLRLTGRQPLRAVVAGVRPLVVPVWIVGGAINLPFGMLFVAAYLWMPWTAVLFLVPLACRTGRPAARPPCGWTAPGWPGCSAPPTHSGSRSTRATPCPTSWPRSPLLRVRGRRAGGGVR
jgi:hypothetical protein